MNLRTILLTGALSLVLAGGMKAAEPGDFTESSYTPEATRFRLFAPETARNVTLRIYKDATSAKPVKTVKMKLTGKETFTATVKGDGRERGRGRG